MIAIFKKLTAEAYKELQPYLEQADYQLCEYNFNCLLMWSFREQYFYCIEENFALIISKGASRHSLMPLCSEQYYKEAIIYLKNYCDSVGHKLMFSYVDESFYQFLETECRKEITVKEIRDCFDYLYLAKEQRELRGKKFDKIRNHINRFTKKYKTSYRYEELGEEHLSLILELIMHWNSQRESDGSDSLPLYYEYLGIKELLDHYADLNYKVGGIFIDSELVAFTIGSYLTPQTVQINVEKGDTDYRGVYQVLQKEFLIKTFPNAIYVNREDDAGIENLRVNKLSSKPVELLAKYTVYFN